MVALAGISPRQIEIQKPSLLEGSNSHHEHDDHFIEEIGEEVPHLRFEDDPDHTGPEFIREFSGSFAGDGEFPEDYRKSQCDRLQKAAEHYKFGKQIGKGGYATVYQVKCKRNRKTFALKEVIVPEEKSVGDIETEISNSSEFDHPNILKLHAFFKEGRTYHLVFDLCTGGNLAEHVERYAAMCRQFTPTYRGGLPCKLVKQYVPQMLSGLLYLHHYDFIHRDIKPHNYMRVCGSSEQLKLCDFGMCVRLPKGEKLRKVCGTRGFMAPEVLFTRSYDLLADVFSLGLTLFALVTDSVPREAETVEAYAAGLQSTMLCTQSWRDANPVIVELVVELLVIDPKVRPSVTEVIARKPWVKERLHEFDRAHPSCHLCSVM